MTIEYGQIWQLGNHRLMCGDATLKEDIDKLLDGEKATLCFTDPPYGVNAVEVKRNIVGGTGSLLRGKEEDTTHTGRTSGHDKFTKSWRDAGLLKLKEQSSRQCSHSKRGYPSRSPSLESCPPPRLYEPIIGDDSTNSARSHFEIIKDRSDNQIIFGGNYFADFLPVRKCWLVWDKQNGHNNNFADGELAWTSFNKPLKIYQWRWSGMIRKGERRIELKERIHPTQKPVGLIQMILEDFSKDGDSVVDCFVGSGSTLIACEIINRTCYAMELSPTYCEKIIDRWETFTGQKAVRIA